MLFSCRSRDAIRDDLTQPTNPPSSYHKSFHCLSFFSTGENPRAILNLSSRLISQTASSRLLSHISLAQPQQNASFDRSDVGRRRPGSADQLGPPRQWLRSHVARFCSLLGRSSSFPGLSPAMPSRSGCLPTLDPSFSCNKYRYHGHPAQQTW